MAQQLNLYDPRFAPQVVRFSARQGLFAVAMIGCLALAATEWLRHAAQGLDADTQALQEATAPLAKQLKEGVITSGPAAEAEAAIRTEIAQLQTIEASLRRIRAALDAGIAGSRQGPSEHLVSLARQANGRVWITGFDLDEGASSLELRGRMLDTGALTDYLRRLKEEPQFSGRPFGQLRLQSGAADQPGAYTEFSLQAGAVGKAPPETERPKPTP